MELVFFLSLFILLATFALCWVVGWVSQKRGRGFALGFWLSVFFTPLIGILILLALGDDGSNPQSEVKSANRIAALEWAKVNNSLDLRDYDDFVQAFPGTREAMLAIKHKRSLQDWRLIDQLDGQAIERFMKGQLFPSLSDEIVRVVEDNSARSNSCADLLPRLQAEQAQRRANFEERKAADLKAKDKKRKRNDQLLLLLYIVIVVAGFVMYLPLLN